MRVFYCPENWLLSFRCIKSTLFNYPKHISNVLDHDPGNVSDGVDVVLGVVRQADAGHEVQRLWF